MSASKQPPASPPTKTGGSGGGGQPQSDVVFLPPGSGETPIVKRRIDLLHGASQQSRLPSTYEFSFQPQSLVGSWFHRLENDSIVWQGAVVAEPQPGVYLLHIEKLDVGAQNVQRLVPLERMLNDDEGYDWRFYDNREQAVAAYTRWVATSRERMA